MAKCKALTGLAVKGLISGNQLDNGSNEWVIDFFSVWYQLGGVIE